MGQPQTGRQKLTRRAQRKNQREHRAVAGPSAFVVSRVGAFVWFMDKRLRVLGDATLRELCVKPTLRSHAGLAPSFMARQIFSGFRGISRWRTPKGASASTTAFTMAGVEAIVPASPTPFTPSGFTGVRVSVEEVSNQGK